METLIKDCKIKDKGKKIEAKGEKEQEVLALFKVEELWSWEKGDRLLR